MELAGAQPDIALFVVEGVGALLFALVFLFLWRQSSIVYFGLWALAWGLQSLALFFGHFLLTQRSAVWLALYAVAEFAFAIILVAAARAGFSGPIREWRTSLRLLFLLPVFVALVFAAGWKSRIEGFHAAHALLLALVYLYNYFSLRKDGAAARRVFRFSLLLLSIAFMQHAIVLLFLYHAGRAPHWSRYLLFDSYFDFALNSLMAFSAMAMWLESQQDRIRELAAELGSVRRESAAHLDLDHLTGLMNQAALERRVEQPDLFEGVVAVCDMDSFKEVNDRYGHLVGDEILRNIGHLLRSSIRPEDEAYRWGGDEFVILFQGQGADLVRKRMEAIESRLLDFRVRGFGSLPITFSWGTAETAGRLLREVLDEADRNMYVFKRTRQS